MAASAMTTEGLAEFQSAVEAFPADIQRALQDVAEAHGRRVQIQAQQTLGPRLRRAIHISLTSDPEKHEVRVEAASTHGYPTSMPLWFEYGTVPLRTKHPARATGQIDALHYMQRAADREGAAYRRELEAVAVATAQHLFKG